MTKAEGYFHDEHFGDCSMRTITSVLILLPFFSKIVFWSTTLLLAHNSKYSLRRSDGAIFFTSISFSGKHCNHVSSF